MMRSRTPKRRSCTNRGSAGGDCVPVSKRDVIHCPSSRPDLDGAFVFAVVNGTPEQPQLAYLKEPQPITEEILKLCAPVLPGEVLRIASPCVHEACKHFDGSNCKLARRLVQLMPVAVDSLPPCQIRPQCRWWTQEGKAACLRCPQVVRLPSLTTEVMRQAAG